MEAVHEQVRAYHFCASRGIWLTTFRSLYRRGGFNRWVCYFSSGLPRLTPPPLQTTRQNQMILSRLGRVRYVLGASKGDMVASIDANLTYVLSSIMIVLCSELTLARRHIPYCQLINRKPASIVLLYAPRNTWIEQRETSGSPSLVSPRHGTTTSRPQTKLESFSPVQIDHLVCQPCSCHLLLKVRYRRLYVCDPSAHQCGGQAPETNVP